MDKQFYIEKVIDEDRVGAIKMTPSHLKMISSRNLKDLKVKRLIVGGEELEASLAKEIYENFGKEIEIYNEYGPTETVVGSMIYKYNPDIDNHQSVPIGVPIANTQIYLLDSHLQPVPVGVEGELYISGDGLARGYMHNPGLTKEKFIPNPFAKAEGEKETKQSKLYRTGDMAVRLPDGNIIYKGRTDHQVKIRGYRVETGEIESRIVEFQKAGSTRREMKEDIVKKLDLKSVTRCTKCLIPENYPGVHFDENGVCDYCREFDNYKEKAALEYFKTNDDFHQVLQKAKASKKGDYDCLMLYSGGKDSSYVLHRLVVEMGLKVLAFTFDNGYISETAFENIRRTTTLLNVKSIILDSEAMKDIFVESLWSDYNVCNGCFKAVNTLGTMVAHKHNINLVVSGLTRGQIFDIKLHGLFQLGVFDEETINERLTLFRKNYHSMTNRTSRLIGVEITDEMLDNIYFVDFFKYDQTPTTEILKYLEEKDSGWIRPTDTGSSSSNCIINDVGIYVHLKDKQFHFYAAQLSWDCRLGTITREEGIEEITEFTVDYPGTHNVLNEIGYYDAFTGAVVIDVTNRDEVTLCAYIVAEKDFNIVELKEYLVKELPDYMIPTYFVPIDRIPLTSSGKVDRKALPKPEMTFIGEYIAPRNEIEKKLVTIWSELLEIAAEKVGIDMNFFEMGGHSLRATFLTAAMHKAFKVKVPLVRIFETPTIRGLAEYITEAAQEAFDSISPTKEKEYYALSPSQGRLYILQQLEPHSTAYHISFFFQIEGEVDRKRLEQTFTKLIARHESLRTSFEIVDGISMQKVHKDVEFKIETYEAPGTAEKKLRQFIRPYELSKAPLIRVALIKNEDNPSAAAEPYVLAVDMHHIITDGVSRGILVRDFSALYYNMELPTLKLQYKDYSQWLQTPAVQDNLKEQKNFWLKELEGQIPVLNMPFDYPRPAAQSFEGTTYRFSIG
ncbi:MAG: AMP-binding protein, partial [bacterium]|nr:AMP-binding protein [bacterium]